MKTSRYEHEPFDDDEPVGKILSRRETLSLLGAAGLTALAIGCGGGSTSSSSSSTGSSTTGSTTGATIGGSVNCVVATPAETQGPYWVDVALDRSDIRSDTSTGTVQPGVQLDLKINLMRVSSSSCNAIENAQIDIWHASASGLYSAESVEGTSSENFLRGYQITDTTGAVSFTTIYPGWYSGRAVHIHFRVRFSYNGTSYDFTSQMFFDDSVTTTVFAQSPYSSRGTRDTFNANDSIYQDEYGKAGTAALLALTQTSAGYTATFNVAMAVS